MREREIPSDLAEESGGRRTSIIGWMLGIVASFALGAFVTHFALLREPIAQFTFQEFFRGPFWSTASIALVSFVLGIGFAFVPFSWYRQDANRVLRTEYRSLRDKTDALRAWQPSRAAEPEETSTAPPYAVQAESQQDIGAVLSEMSQAIRANLREPSSTRPARADPRPPPRPKLSGE